MTTTTASTTPATAPPTWTDLRYAGEAAGWAYYFARHPEAGITVTLTYDRRAGTATSAPPCPALEPLARFATLARDAGAALRQLRLAGPQLAALLAACELAARARPGDERGRADLAAVRAEIARRERQGAEAQARGAGRPARARSDAELAELFGD